MSGGLKQPGVRFLALVWVLRCKCWQYRRALLCFAPCHQHLREALPFARIYSALPKRLGDNIAALSPWLTNASGKGNPRASDAQASPIAALVWMP